MPFPTSDQLEERVKDIDASIAALKDAYSDFTAAWDHLSAEEKKELSKLAEYIDKKQIHAILENISSLKE